MIRLQPKTLYFKTLLTPASNGKSATSTNARWTAVGLAALVWILTASVTSVSAWQERQRGRSRAEADTSVPSDEESGEDQRISEGPITAIVGADVYTVSREIVRRGTVLLQGGKILDVGQDLKIPEDAVVTDAAGKYVTPGFIAISAARLGGRLSSSRGSRVADSLDPFDRDLKLALGAGITTISIEVESPRRRASRSAPPTFLGFDQPLSSDDAYRDAEFRATTDSPDRENAVCKCCGLPVLPAEPLEPITPSRGQPPTSDKHVVLKLTFGELEPMLVSETPFYRLSAQALTGAMNRHNWRTQIARARSYLDEVAKHQQTAKGDKKSRPPKKTVSDALIKLVNKEIYLRTRADSVDQIRDMVGLAKELDYKLMLDGVAEGWIVAEELGEASVPVIFTPRRYRAPQLGRENTTGSSIEMSGGLEAAGVHFAISTLSNRISTNGLAGRDLTSLALEAAFAVRGGASEKRALEAITIVPAQLLGLGDRVGSIEKGKDADLLILDGPPLDYRTYVEQAIVAGKVRYDRQKDDIYPVFERPF